MVIFFLVIQGVSMKLLKKLPPSTLMPAQTHPVINSGEMVEVF